MTHKEYKAKIGETVYICDYRLNEDRDNKPIRHIKPTKVMVTSNEELPKNKTVYYSDYHFRPFGKNGQPLSKVIAPYDNTGYRGYTGVSLNIFYTEEECIKHYIEQCKTVMKEYQKERDDVIKSVKEKTQIITDEIFKWEK